MVDSAGWSRRQFLARSGGAFAVLALGGLADAGGAEALSVGELSREQGVLEALVSAIVVATGISGDGSGLGLQPAAGIAQAIASAPADVQARLVGLLDEIETAPGSGSFSSLSGDRLQAFMPRVLAPLKSLGLPAPAPVPIDLDAALGGSGSEADGMPVESIAPEWLYYEPPDPDFSAPVAPLVRPPLTRADQLANAVLDGLLLVSTPPPPPFVPPPAPPSFPPLLLAGLLDEVLAQAPLDQLQPLIDQLLGEVDLETSVPQPPPGPVPLLDAAIAVWLNA